MNVLYWDTSKGELDKVKEIFDYLQEKGITDILLLPDYAYLQQDCSKESLIWWRDQINKFIEDYEK